MISLKSRPLRADWAFPDLGTSQLISYTPRAVLVELSLGMFENVTQLKIVNL